MSTPLGPHHCSACGDIHGGETVEAPEVAIARINREADVEIARIGRGEAKAITETQGETDIAVAEIHAAAGVEETEALAEAVVGSDSEEIPPVVVDAPADDIEPEVEASIAPADDIEEPSEPVERRSKSLSYWP